MSRVLNRIVYGDKIEDFGNTGGMFPELAVSFITMLNPEMF